MYINDKKFAAAFARFAAEGFKPNNDTAELALEHDELVTTLADAQTRNNSIDIRCAQASLDWFYQDHPEFQKA